MTQKIINLGTAANKGDGDVLRTAFGKVNDNFTEVYAAMGADVQIPSQATHDGKYLTTNGTTLSWATVATGTTLPSLSGQEGKFLRTDGGVLSWVAITTPTISELVSGAYSVTVESTGALRADVQAIISDNQLAIEGNGLLQMQTLDGPYISIFNESGTQEINLVAYNGIDTDTYPTWTFDTRGTLTVPSPFPKTFTATVDSAHYYGEGSLTLSGDAWSFEVTFAIGADGEIETQIANNTPWPSNPGYTNGVEFRFVEADHGIPGYTFDLTLIDIQNPGPMMYTTNLAANDVPTLPATIISSETVKLTADSTSWLFTPNGDLTVPGNILSSDPAGLTIGANYNVYIVADQTDNNLTWTFDGSTGSLTLPNLGTITNPSGGGAPTGTIYTFNTDYASGSPTLSAAEYIDLAAGGNADNVETSWVITFANGTTKTVTSRVFTSTPDRQRISWTGELTIFLIADVWPLTIQSADYSAGTTTKSLELTPDGTTTWTFGDDGALTFPSGILANLGGAEFGTGFSLTTDGDQAIIGASNLISLETSGGVGQLHLTQDTETNKGRVEIFFQNGPGVLWIFDEEDSSLTFPDNTTQTTAWTGSVSSLVNGANTVSLDNGGLDLTFTSGEKIKTFVGGGIELYRSGDNTIGIYNGYARINTFTTGGAKHTWEFDSTGTLSLPDAGIVKAGADTAQVGSSLVIETGSAYGDTAVSIAADPTLATTYPAGSTITFQDGDVRTITAYDNYPGGTDIFWDTPKTGTLFPITLKTANYAAAYTAPEWTFGTDGRTTFPFNMLATDSQLIIQSDGETEIRNLSETNGIDIVTNITNGDTRWSFGIDSTLTLPAPLAQLTNTNQLDSDTAKIYRATNSTDAEAIQSAWNTWYGNEWEFRLYVQEDESSRGSNFPWHDMPSWEAYPLILNWNGGGLPLNPAMAPAAVAAINSYLAYKELVSSIDIVNGNKTISFDNTGVLSLPGKLEFKDTANAKIILKTIDPYGYVVEDSEQDKTWTFNTNGSLTFPDTTVQTTAYTGTAATATSTSTAASVGYIGMPQNSKSANYELVIGDMGKHVYVTATSTVTVPAYTSVNFPIGTTIAVVAGTGATVTIDITTDTMNLAGTGTTGTRTLAAFGMATLVKVAESTWFISGVGLT
jgi:hypothetical protein